MRARITDDRSARSARIRLPKRAVHRKSCPRPDDLRPRTGSRRHYAAQTIFRGATAESSALSLPPDGAAARLPSNDDD